VEEVTDFTVLRW